MTNKADAKKISLPEPQSLDSKSDESWRTAEKWISQCSHGHPKCNTLYDTSWFPTCLICISKDKSSKVTARLVDTAKEPPTLGRYVTLSHCWGRAQIAKLLRSNSDTMKCDMPVAALPKTF
jgi:hypothetical protein